MNEFEYENLISRNYGYIEPDLQQKIKSAKIVFVGCGLSSIIIEAAARIGFTHFVLFDFDKIELSNLNRQIFSLNDIGKYKVEVIKQRLIAINPQISVEISTKKIVAENDINQALSSGDIIVNTIDYGNAYYDLVHRGMKQAKIVICPFNPGFAGMVVCFTKHSGNLFDLLKCDEVLTNTDFPLQLRKANCDKQLPKPLLNLLNNLLPTIESKKYSPQIVIGAQLSSMIVLKCIIQYLNNENITLAPSIIYKEI